MNKPPLLKWKMAASLCMALLAFGSSAIAAVTVTLDNQNGSDPFTPAWTPALDSLIAGLTPNIVQGSFNQETCSGDVAALTAGGSLTVPSGYSAACGEQAGNLLVYTLPASAHGYNITNITTYSGWANGGRDGQDYTIYYSTVDAPGFWIALPGASFRNDGSAVGNPTCNRVTINDSSDGTATIAANVYSVMFDFGNPGAENGWVGMGAITVEGTAASGTVSPLPISITTANENGGNPFTPSWTAETPNLIAGLSPSASGSFNNESCGGTSKLTDGAVGISGNNSTMASCGAGGGNTIIYTLPNSANGYDVTNIVTYSGWANNGRFGQYYELSYSTVAAPSTFIPLTSVYYLPNGVPNAPACRVAVNTPTEAALATNVSKIKFDFSSPPEANRFNNAWQGYSEIVVQGTNSAPLGVAPSPILTQDILPTTAVNVVGDQVVLKAAFGDSPPASLQWQQIVGLVTNNINTGVVNVTNGGVITSSLTLDNVQLGDAGSYQVIAVNATNGAAAPTYTTVCSLEVGSVPAHVGNTVVKYAGQTVVSVSSYAPLWDASMLNSSLIHLQSPSATSGPISDFTTPGGNGENASGPVILTDGNIGTVDTSLTGNNSNLTCIGDGGSSCGNWVTYTLAGSANGYTITNITSYGGSQNHDRDKQAFTVYYATTTNPSSFLPLAVVNFNPASLPGMSFTRATITPFTGALATNVGALMFDMRNPAGENGYSLYGEIGVYGSPSMPLTAPTIASQQYVDRKLIVTGTGGTPGATYSWLVATNLSAPIIWTTNSTGTLDGTGAFSNTIAIDPSQEAGFFRMQLP